MADAGIDVEVEPARVRREWCLWLGIGLVVLGAMMNAIYLFNHCPIGLSEDEAHYWEWSRHLDYGYYSKPPGIAWVIWTALKIGTALGITGDGSGTALMPVVRLPAVLFGLCSGLLSFFLARRMFRDDRAGLSVIVLSAAVPMFAVGSLLITIDSPMYLCWAATVFCLWRSIEVPNRRDVAWLYAAGLCAAMGMMFKPVLIAIPICALVAAWADGRGGPIRKVVLSIHGLGALLVMMLSQVPVVVWNAGHGWVMFRHILTQGGLGKQAGEAGAQNGAQKILLDPLARIGEYLGGQAGGMGGIMFVLLVIAVVVVWLRLRKSRESAAVAPHIAGTTRTGWIFLLSFTLPLWGFYFLMNLWKRTEVNWPAASYFTGMILLAGLFVEGWNSPDLKNRRTWRAWGTIAIIWGFLLTMAALNMQRFYPIAAERLAPLQGKPEYFKSPWHPTRWDQPTVRLRGMNERAAAVEAVRQELRAQTGQVPLIITSRYDTSSSLAFYLPGHPFVYSIMSRVGGRMTQYDLWPGLDEKGPDGKLTLSGRPAVIVGDFPPWAIEQVLKPAFEKLTGPEKLPVVFDGIVLRQVQVYRGYGFKGLPAAPLAGGPGAAY